MFDLVERPITGIIRPGKRQTVWQGPIQVLRMNFDGPLTEYRLYENGKQIFKGEFDNFEFPEPLEVHGILGLEITGPETLAYICTCVPLKDSI